MRKIILVGLTLVLAACASSEVTTVSPNANGQYQSVLVSKYPRLLTFITAAAVRQRDNNGLLQASVDLHNEAYWTKSLQYKFRWFDASGFEVQSDGRPWTPITLVGKEVKPVQATAPQGNVVSFKIMIEEV